MIALMEPFQTGQKAVFGPVSNLFKLQGNQNAGLPDQWKWLPLSACLIEAEDRQNACRNQSV